MAQLEKPYYNKPRPCMGYLLEDGWISKTARLAMTFYDSDREQILCSRFKYSDLSLIRVPWLFPQIFVHHPHLLLLLS